MNWDKNGSFRKYGMNPNAENMKDEKGVKEMEIEAPKDQRVDAVGNLFVLPYEIIKI